MVLRSDEAANEAEIERDQRMRKRIGQGAATAASLGTAALAGPLASRVMPFLNQYIPSALAVKGIEKVSPKLGAMLKKGQEMGLNVEEGLDFIKSKIGSAETGKEAQQIKNIIEQESPELFKFLDQEIRKGRKPIEAGAIAQSDKRFMKVIKELTKKHKAPWSGIIESIFGGGEMGLPQQPMQQPIQPQGGSGAKEQLLQAMQALSQKLRT